MFTIKKFHKYLSLFISIQLLLWTISGIFFSFNKIEEVRGEHLKKPEIQEPFSVNEAKFTSDSATITYHKRLSDLVVEVKSSNGIKYFDQKGNLVNKLSFDDAKNIVTQRTYLSPTKILEITEPEEGSEFRGRSLPLYKVESLSNEGKVINIYLNPYSGKIEALRSNQWRAWDFFWALHIMDWDKREDFSNTLLRIFSILALFSALSGIILFFRIRYRPSKKTDSSV
jgi:uncharacterized iron-regulated membrane protein